MKGLLYMIVLLVVTGCSCSNRQVERSLDEAASMLHSDPGAAMERLLRYDLSTFSDSSTMARWALLYSEALVANNITVPTDTIVNIAVDYYGRHNHKELFRHASRLKALLTATDKRDELSSALYLQKEKEFLLYKERMRNRQILYTGIICLLIAVGVILWQRQRIRLREAQNEMLVAEAYSLKEGLTRNQSAYTDLRSRLSDLLSTRFQIIDQLCGTYYESQGTKTERKAIADKVKTQIEEVKSDSGLFSEMEKCVNDCSGGMIDILHDELPDMKPEEYRLFVYLACNLSNRSIALLLGESIDVVYKRKSRLKSKISNLNPPHSSVFLAVF